MARRIELEVNYDDSNAPGFYTNFDDYGAILYYAFTVNKNLALELYKSMVSEYSYKEKTGMPVGELTNVDSNVYISLNDLPQVITFINNQILPSLQLLPLNLDLTKTWNIGNSLESFLMKQGSFFDYFNIDNIEQDDYTTEYFISVFSKLRDFFQEVVNKNVIYKVAIV
ncbi:hypothetical protein BSF41_40600 [Flavobacterium sp. ACN2]|uniref:hypothetical protein n=1 Tax=unclassified Flavobacterium TaxID=196869 RepID=UPI000BB36A81|nr:MULTISPECIES: hypothetical protein [unclassified Flavobacterium]MDY0990346.1 hypothetical protein [Flavobacterium sp. CFBP9031]PBI84732.1 hypothetical protein BSF41_40600 [Flavobacterium sp. ACN2]